MIRAIRRRLAVGPSADEGVTLVELLITMLVSAVVLTMVSSWMIQNAKSTVLANERRVNASLAANVSNAATALIRAGTALGTNGTTPVPSVIAGTAESLTLYTFSSADKLNPSPTRVRIRIESDRRLSVTTWPTTDGTGTPKIQYYEGLNVAPASGEAPLFTYLDGNNVILVPGGTGLTAAQMQNVASVTVTARVVAKNSKTIPAVVVQNTVGMPNLGIQATED